jgi:hypothetical protein
VALLSLLCRHGVLHPTFSVSRLHQKRSLLVQLHDLFQSLKANLPYPQGKKVVLLSPLVLANPALRQRLRLQLKVRLDLTVLDVLMPALHFLKGVKVAHLLRGLQVVQ